MKKKILLTINALILILLLPLVGCNKKHTHTYEDTYSYDDAGHWYKSTCKHDLKKDYGTHTYEVSIISPTYETGGYTLHTCSVCGYSYKDTYTDVLLKTYNITYNLDGGTNNNSNPASYNKETDTIYLKDPTKTGYAFTGWTTDTITTPEKNLTIEKGSTGNKTFTANWQLLYSYVDANKTSLYFGAYPQTKVSDDSIMTSLNNLAGTLPTSSNTYSWTDYGYYMEGTVSSYMYYIDIDYDNNGDYDYRGVYFTSYRPFCTVGNNLSSNYQSTNGYSRNIVYWFKYEPIKWNILKTDNNKALLISELIIDSQDYNYTNDARSSATDYEGNSTTSEVYGNNYMYSHIRSWLNTTFYDTAFTTLEKQIIETTTVDNSPSSTSNSDSTYACQNTNDKIFLLSYSEVTTYYSSKSARCAQSSDYAKAQGIYVYQSSGISCYWLRSPGSLYNYTALDVLNDGGTNDYRVSNNETGVRSACWINL